MTAEPIATTEQKRDRRKAKAIKAACQGLSLEDLEDAAAQPDHRKRLAKLTIAAWRAYRRSVEAYRDFARAIETGWKCPN